MLSVIYVLPGCHAFDWKAFLFNLIYITSAERKRNKEAVDLLEAKIVNLTMLVELLQQIVPTIGENNRGKSKNPDQ